MQCLQYNRRTCSIKTAQRQQDLTSDNTCIHHHAPGDSTSLHIDSSQQSTHTHTNSHAHAHRCVTKSANAQHTTAHVRNTTNRTGLLVCRVSVRACIHIYYSSACEHMNEVSLVGEIRGFFILSFACVWMNVCMCVFLQSCIKQCIS